MCWQLVLCSSRELVFSVGQKVSEPAWMMRKTKYFWGAFAGRGSKWEKVAGENARMLPRATHEEKKQQEAKRRGKLKTMAGKLLKVVASGKEAAEEKAGGVEVAGNLLKMATSRKGVEGRVPAEEAICGFIEQGKFLEACDHIYNLEHSGSDEMGKSESLYKLLAERMWTVVGEALSGSGRMFLEPLRSVGESLKWEKQKEAEWLGSSQETGPVSTWSPNFWRKELEEQLIQYMTAWIPPLSSSANANENVLNQHLSQLETSFLPSLEHGSGVFEEAGLLSTYTYCCHASLSSHLATLTDSSHFSFTQCLLVYEWGLKMYKSGNETCLRPRQTPQHSLSFSVRCLLWIVLKTEEKLLAVAKKEVGKALKEAFDIGKPPCADAAVIQGTLKEHFKKCDSSFHHILESLKQSFLVFGKKKTDTYEQALVKAVNAIIIAEYVQALLTTSRKLSSVQRRRIVSKMEEDHRMLQDIFKECLGPAAGHLKDPIQAILELIQAPDSEGMKIALLPILREFPDLRKEHLSAVLNIKVSLNREDRAALLEAFHDNCRDSNPGVNLLFADIEVKPGKYGLCACLCC
ncbi:uncharacterized protein LOC133224645 isoform X5 [Neopsephotus bourkii]|uniref:uncharacterized protein LOC133224645 isoform X5 n=1 Tax=Neopsephotus bourkii TaxID=309878 RepID=UPI002AA537D9|nr:uncharacterized protein LOC133224645 isoform X5 [Neopsephotus bourkii]